MKTIQPVNSNLIKTLDVVLYKFIIVPPAIVLIAYFILEFFKGALVGNISQEDLLMMSGFSVLCLYLVYMGYKLVFCRATDAGLQVKGYFQSEEIPTSAIRSIEVSPGLSNTQFVYVKLHEPGKFGSNLWLITRTNHKVHDPETNEPIPVVKYLKSKVERSVA